MEIMPTRPAAVGQPPAQPERQSAASDFQTFLTLLTAQMRNQDPLKPIESTEFVAQLASFSAVEQQIRSNDRLDRIVEALSGGSPAGLAQWIGREIRAPLAADFRGQPVEVEMTPHPNADRAVLVVRNAFDQVVARQPLDPGRESATWDGQNSVGQPQPHGSYRFEIESYAGDRLLATEAGRVFATITEVRFVDGVPHLLLGTGEKIELGAVTAVR